MCHWIATDIYLPASAYDSSENAGMILDAAGGVVTAATELVSYYAPSPPPKTGYHRYVFVLLAPEGTNSPTGEQPSIKKPKGRAHWGYGTVREGVRRWAKDNHLKAVGKSTQM